MDCNVCGERDAGLTVPGDENGDANELFLCARCWSRFVADTSVQRVGRIQAP